MANKATIQHLRSSIPGQHPDNLEPGQIGVNHSEQGTYLYFGTGGDDRVDSDGSDFTPDLTGTLTPSKGWVRVRLGYTEPPPPQEIRIPICGLIEVVDNSPFPVFQPDSEYEIKSLRVALAQGSCRVTVKIDGVPVTGMEDVQVTSSSQLFLSQDLNLVSPGSRVVLEVSESLSAYNLEFTMVVTQ